MLIITKKVSIIRKVYTESYFVYTPVLSYACTIAITIDWVGSTRVVIHVFLSNGCPKESDVKILIHVTQRAAVIHVILHSTKQTLDGPLTKHKQQLYKTSKKCQTNTNQTSNKYPTNIQQMSNKYLPIIRQTSDFYLPNSQTNLQLISNKPLKNCKTYLNAFFLFHFLLP